jgi:hypothetical protein
MPAKSCRLNRSMQHWAFRRSGLPRSKSFLNDAGHHPA